MNTNLHEIYKPFRNRLRRYNLYDSLYLMWAYSRNFILNYPFPPEIQLHYRFNPSASIDERRVMGVPEFEQEFFVKEFLKHCHTDKCAKSLQSIQEFIKVVNYSRDTLMNKASDIRPLKDSIFNELYRLSHDQFKWWFTFSRPAMNRYYKVYSHSRLAPLVEEATGLSVRDIFVLGLYYFHQTSQKFIHQFPDGLKIPTIPQEKINQFFINYSMTVEEARQEVRESEQMDENLYYSYNPLNAKPILFEKNNFFCPMPILLFWQFTSGTYYWIVNKEGFGAAMGKAFEDYIGEVLHEICGNGQVEIIPEIVYGKEVKRSSDWLLIDNSGILFIECKSKRLTMPSKTKLDIKEGLESDLRTMAEYIRKQYKTSRDYKAGKYSKLKYDLQKLFVPLIVTLDDWYIGYNPHIEGILKSYVIEELTKHKVSLDIIEQHPYHVWSANQFEGNLWIIKEVGIRKYFTELSREQKDEIFGTLETRVLFEEDFEKEVIDTLKE